MPLIRNVAGREVVPSPERCGFAAFIVLMWLHLLNDPREGAKAMGKPEETKRELQKQMVDICDNIVLAQYFTFAGLLLGPASLLGGSWIWDAAAVGLLVVSLISAIQWWRLQQRKKELLRRGVKEPDYGKPPDLEGIERLLRE
jgi:hypothetical protein